MEKEFFLVVVNQRYTVVAQYKASQKYVSTQTISFLDQQIA